MSEIAQPSWVAEVSTPQELRIIRDAAEGPMAAFCRLSLDESAQTYLRQLDFQRDYLDNADHPLCEERPPFFSLGEDACQWVFDVYGLGIGNSERAKNNFRANADVFFPDCARNCPSLMETLTDAFSGAGAGLSGKIQLFVMRYQNYPERRIHEHYDVAEMTTGRPVAYTTIAYLQGAAATLIHENESWQLPSPSLCVWRGMASEKPLRHAATAGEGIARIHCIGIASP